MAQYSEDAREPMILRAGRVRPAFGTGTASTDDAEAVLIRDGRIAAVGGHDELRCLAPEAALVHLPDATITPGLTDSHVHLVEWAVRRTGVDLVGLRSPKDVAAAVADHASREAAAGDWVLGRGWNPHLWSEAPDRTFLDSVVPGRPVVLQSLDMHSLWLNTAALSAAGLDAGTPDPDGGRLERRGDGELTGVVRDNAMPLVERAVPSPTPAHRRAAVLDGQSVLHRWGVTGVHTVEPDSLGLLEGLNGAGLLRLRVLQHLPLARLDDAIRLGIRSGFGGEWVRIGGVKMFLDGALGSLTAWMREPYEGSGDLGVQTLSGDDFRDAVRRGSEAGLAMTVHAIGDAAMDLALDVLGSPVARVDGPVPHRIEHAQLVGGDRLGSAGSAGSAGSTPDPAFHGLVCSVQPSHLMTDWPAADRHWGDRARFAYAFRSLEEAGAILAFGSDAPVDTPDPRLGLFAAVRRQDLDGRPADGWFAHERLSIERALAGYTSGAARAAGDARQGRLRAGAFADLVAWEADPLLTPPDGLRDLRPVLTMVGGTVVWRED